MNKAFEFRDEYSNASRQQYIIEVWFDRQRCRLAAAYEPSTQEDSSYSQDPPSAYQSSW